MRPSLLSRLGGLVFDLVLVGAIALGMFFRFSWTNWNQNTDLHPDEYGLTSTLTRLEIPKTVEDYFNTRISPVSPYARYDEAGNKIGDGPDNVMRWGQWPIILLKWSATLTENTGYTEQRLFGRQMSALADAVAVFVIVIIGWRLYSLRHGLLAGALSALAVMQIQQSHFMTSDTIAVAFTALALWMAVEVSLVARAGHGTNGGDGPGHAPSLPGRAWVFAASFGVFGAMALASRVNLAPLLVLIGVAAYIAAARLRRGAGPVAPGLAGLMDIDWRPVIALSAVAAIATLLTYRLVHPMSFRAPTGDTTLFTLNPNPDWLHALSVSAAESSLKAGGPPAEQWTGRTQILFPWLNMVLWGMGLPLGLTSWAGLVWMAWRSLAGGGGRGSEGRGARGEGRGAGERGARGEGRGARSGGARGEGRGARSGGARGEGRGAGERGARGEGRGAGERGARGEEREAHGPAMVGDGGSADVSDVSLVAGATHASLMPGDAIAADDRANADVSVRHTMDAGGAVDIPFAANASPVPGDGVAPDQGASVGGLPADDPKAETVIDADAVNSISFDASAADAVVETPASDAAAAIASLEASASDTGAAADAVVETPASDAAAAIASLEASASDTGAAADAIVETPASDASAAADAVVETPASDAGAAADAVVESSAVDTGSAVNDSGESAQASQPLIDPEWMRHALPVLWVAGMFLFMGTRAVMSVRYFLPIYPFLALCAAWALLKVWDWATTSGVERREASGPLRRGAFGPLRVVGAGALVALVLGGTAAWAYGFTNIYRTDNTRVRAARWIYQNIPGPVNVFVADGSGAEVLIPISLNTGQSIESFIDTVTGFTPRVDGTVTRVSVGFARNRDDSRVPGVLHVILSSDPGGATVLAEANIVIAATDPAGDPRGAPAEAVFAQPATVQAGVGYYVLLRATSGGPLAIAGATISNENWDESLPMRMDGYDPFGGLYIGRTMEMHWSDAPNKRDMIAENLAQVDYILVQSQRRLWASTRIPATYPMTMEYYKALFDGRLGYELVGEFQNPIVIGPLQVSDAAGTVAWGQAPDLTPNVGNPFNDNLFAAEEAFTIYDHAPVWIFRKRADFDLARALAILDSVDLNTVVVQGPLDASRAGTLLRLPDDLRAIQQAGGTWSQMFDLNGLLNTNQPLAVVVWYLLVLALGVLAFPLTHVAFKGLADGGYPLARSVGLLVVAWLAWIAGSLRALPFTQATLWLAVIILGLISATLAMVRRRELLAYLREHWKHILIVEALALVLFVGFLLVRLGNPDLWHPSKGGEKPMDFSYFNAVLRSTYFPPYDPWYAGGYLNYYYYGFVLMGVPTKLLGIMPSLAYNVILPTFYALLGLNAFSVAWNLVARGAKGGERTARSERREVSEAEPQSGEGGAATQSSLVAPRPSSYLAGFAAVLLMGVLGNLGQVYTYLAGFQRAADPLLAATSPNDGALLIANGLYRVVTGQGSMGIPLDWWYWNGSRVLAYTNNSSDFSEFPLFTFLYADPHAHLAALPFTVLVLAWGLAYLKGFAEPRRLWEWAIAFGLGGLALGVLRPTNTWDYPMYLAVTVVAVGGAWLWHRRVIDGRLLFGLGLHLGLVIGLSQLLYRPFDQWFVPAYTELKRFEGPTTEMLGYLYWYGLYLFLFGFFVLSEIGRWLSETSATVLAQAGQWAMPVMVFASGVLLALAALLYLKVDIAWIAWLLLVLAGLLAFRRHEDTPLGKRVVLFLLGTGMAVTIFVELFTLGGDRMNTIFKLYVQVWVLFAIGGAAALAYVWADRAAWSPTWRGMHTGALVMLLVFAGLYPATALPAKMSDRFPSYSSNPTGSNSGCDQIAGQPAPYEAGLPIKDQPHSLDGMQFMSFSAFCLNGSYLPLQYDYDAIRWLQQNVQGSPVIVEAQTFDLYVMGSRYAWFTGLPNVVGWDWHQRQQRGAVGSDFEVTQRGREVTDFYCAGAPAELILSGKYGNCANVLQYADDGAAFVETFLTRYAPRYVIVGPMERAYYPAEGLDKFERLAGEGLMRIAYQNPGVTIYEVIQK